MAKADYGNLCIEYARALQEDLGGLLGSNVRLKGPKLEVVDAAGAAPDAASLAHTSCSAKDDSGHVFHFVVPADDALAMAGLLMGLDGDALEEKRKAGLDDETLDAFGQVMETATAILTRIHESMELPGMARAETRAVSAQDDAGWLPETNYKRASWTLALDGDAEARFDLLVPESSMEAWFGTSLEADVAAGESPGAGAALPTAAEGATLVVIDPDPSDREAAEDLEDALGRPVWAVDPEQLTAASFEEFADAAAIVLAWQQGVSSGLDILPALFEHPATAQARVALAAESFTRRKVATALRAGADTVVSKPYVASELAARLGLGMTSGDGVEDEAGDDGGEVEAADGGAEAGEEDAAVEGEGADEAGEPAEAEAEAASE